MHINAIPEKSSLRIDQHDRFFSKLLSKEASAANSSSRLLYYDSAARAVPFVWESRPGTPKHMKSSPFSFDSTHGYNMPFLTPPPYYVARSSCKYSGSGFEVKTWRGSRFLRALVSKLSQKMSVMSPTCSVSLSSSSFPCSSSASSPAVTQKTKSCRERHANFFSCSRSDGKDYDSVRQDYGTSLVGFGSRSEVPSGNQDRMRGLCF